MEDAVGRHGKAGNEKVQTLVGSFCGVLYGLILGCADMDDQVTRSYIERIAAPSRPRERACTTLAPVSPHET